MTPAAAPRGRPASAGQLSIGQVIARLLPDFPDLSASKLRYFEDQGLVTPLRTEAGYRKFSPADVARVRTALTLQRDHDFKLARIREYLDAHDGEPEVALPASILEAPRRYRRDPAVPLRGQRHRPADRRGDRSYAKNGVCPTRAATRRVAVRGAVSVIVDGVDGAQEVSGASVATWSERFVASAARVTIAAGVTGEDAVVPLRSGVARADLVVVTVGAASPSAAAAAALADDPAVADAEAPLPEVVPVDAPEPPAAENAVGASSPSPAADVPPSDVTAAEAPPVDAPPAPPSPPPIPPAPTTGPIAGVGDTLGPAMTTALPEAPEEHEMIWGETIARPARPPRPAPSAQTRSAPEAQAIRPWHSS